MSDGIPTQLKELRNRVEDLEEETERMDRDISDARTVGRVVTHLMRKHDDRIRALEQATRGRRSPRSKK